MHSFQAKIGLKKMRKRENKNYYYISFLSEAYLKIPRKQQKNSKKLKYTIMPLFQAKIGWKMPGKTEYENYRSEERRVGIERTDDFYFFSFSEFSILFWLEMKP